MDNREQVAASVLERINAIIASGGVQPQDGDEWPTLAREQVDGFRELVYDLANLAFEPDYKERNVLHITIADKKRFNVREFFSPVQTIDFYDADFNDPDVLRAFSDMTRSAESMISQGTDALKRISDVTSYRASQIREKDEKKSALAGLRAILESGKLEDFPSERDRVLDVFDPPRYAGTGEDAKTPYNRIGNSRSIPQELQNIIDDYGFELKRAQKTDLIDQQVAELTPFLDQMEERLGQDHRTHGSYEGSYDEAYSAAREVINLYRYQIGTRTLPQPVVVRYNRLQNEHRAIQTLRERGLQVVPVAA